MNAQLPAPIYLANLRRLAFPALFACAGVLAGCESFLHAPNTDAALAERILPNMDSQPPRLETTVDAKPDPGCPEPHANLDQLPNGPLSLDQALGLANQNNPRLKQMQARVDIARAGKTIAFAEFLPEANTILRHVQGTPSSEKFGLPTIPTYLGNVSFGGTSDSFQTAELNLQWTIFQFGRAAGRYGQANDAVEIAELQYQRAGQTVAFDTTVAYLAVLRDQSIRKIAEEALRRAEVVLHDARNFQKRGTGIRNDVLRAEVLVSESRLNVVKARTAEGVAFAALYQVMGIHANTTALVSDAVPERGPTLARADALRLAVANRQEFAAALRAVASARLGTDVARADFFPKIVVGASAVQQDASGEAAAHLLSGGIGLEMDLFEGGRRLGKLAWCPG